MNRSRKLPLLLIVVLSLVFFENGSSTSEAFQRSYQATLEESFGLQTAIFSTPEGTIRVNLPDDAAAGDVLSGTVYTAPAGRNSDEQQKNRAELTGYSVEISGITSPASERVIKFELPESGGTEAFNVVLRNDADKSVAELEMRAEAAPIDEQPSFYRPPSRAQAGRWVNIHGPFDGDLFNTELEIGGVQANPLAESPRKAVFQSPANVAGLTTLVLRERDDVLEQPIRNISVSLSAGKLNLNRGETTELTLRVEGLAGIENDVNVDLSCTGVADMQGGNNQRLKIAPHQVNNDGSYTETKRLTGRNIGGFGVVANVQTDQQQLKVTDQPVHVETNPVNIGSEDDKVWYVKVKTLDGQLRSIYIRRDFKPALEICNWIKIDESEVDDDGWEYVDNYTKVEDPTAPCELKDKTVKVEGDPIGPVNGGWQVRVTGPDGKTIYIYVAGSTKPGIKKGQWIRIRDCKKLSSNSYAVDGYDVNDDPNAKPPVPSTPEPTPTPTATPDPPPVASPKPCTEGDRKRGRTVRRVFEIITEESEISFKVYPDQDSGRAADGMAAWLNGSQPIRDFLGDNLPDGAGAGGLAAGAVLAYVDRGAEIITALAKSKLRNLAVTDVTAELFITTRKITATCTSYEICINGRWEQRKEFSERSEESTYRRSKRVTKGGNGWEQVSETSRPQFFDPDKAEAWGKEFLKKELKKLKTNGDNYKKFKENCR
ncbi:MAG: hypothetical protein DWQ47_01820 [Acidobacteria bacterium]|nr:MAG: hypothetical protein DWQ32_05370 [Acidobacteriota bacterium]REK01162.1 MAG: hypothetical protein DWQ38_01805 [Acidobacteriota bacterium]REK14118.1 MAG: hypothetical protein DWQ43_11060 [Acidobacteriota bacterium]REK44833.1 MAG: hypothetical protein DWQ47_01820 [Acidobacteriota bacterium]